jgi:hypothetical protein
VDVKNNGPAYTSATGLEFLPWCLRLVAGDNVPAGGDLVMRGCWWPRDAMAATGDGVEAVGGSARRGER